MLKNLTFELKVAEGAEGAEAVRLEVFSDQRTIIAYIPNYILEDLGSINELSKAKRREQYIAVINQHQKIILEKIIEKYNRNEQVTIHLISNDFKEQDVFLDT